MHYPNKTEVQYVKITIDDIKKAKKSLKRSSAAGDTGIGPVIVKEFLKDEKN